MQDVMAVDILIDEEVHCIQFGFWHCRHIGREVFATDGIAILR